MACSRRKLTWLFPLCVVLTAFTAYSIISDRPIEIDGSWFDAISLRHNEFSGRDYRTEYKERYLARARRNVTVSIAMVCCGSRLQEGLTMIKSAILLTDASLHFHIVTTQLLRHNFTRTIDEWIRVTNTTVRYRFYEPFFPNTSGIDSKVWYSLYRECSAQRLFMHNFMTDVELALYVDTDVIFLSPPEHVWAQFRAFNASHMVSMAMEQLPGGLGWYDHHRDIPRVGKQGANSGVMLMNLTRIRTRSWNILLEKYLRKYKKYIQLGDQDLLNIYFHFNPSSFVLLPCQMNFRPDYCNSNASVLTCEKAPGILHGNQRTWYNGKEPVFSAVYNAFNEHDMLAPLFDLTTAVCTNLNKVSSSKCGVISHSILDSLVYNSYQQIDISESCELNIRFVN